MQLNFPIKRVLIEELNRKSTKSSSQSNISLSLCYIFTSKFNFSDFIHEKSTEVYTAWCSCVYQNLHCIGETKINNLAWSSGWQSISCSLRVTAWLEDSCWDRTAWITSRVGRVLQANTLSSVYIWAAQNPCGTSMQLFNVNQKHSEIILLMRFHRRTEWPQMIYCAWLTVEGQDMFR